jgi:hypothetical protein
MRKLITGVIVAFALAVMATPAFAIHHGSHLGTFVPFCAQSSNAIGGNAHADANANKGRSNSFGLTHNHASPRCRGLVDN